MSSEHGKEFGYLLIFSDISGQQIQGQILCHPYTNWMIVHLTLLASENEVTSRLVGLETPTAN